MNTLAALDDLTARLRAAGFGSVSVEGGDLDPAPVAIWLQARSLTGWDLAGGATLTANCYLICGVNNDTRQTMTVLDDALSGVLEHVTLTDDEPIDLGTAIVLPHTQAPFPAYRLGIDLDLQE